MNNRLFTDYWSFRLLSPVITGSVIYLLILLINNNIDQILESFISDEFFVCVVLALFVSEATRLFLALYMKLDIKLTPGLNILVILLSSTMITAVIIYIALSFYFQYALGYQPNMAELQPFILLYSGLSMALASVFLSNHFIQKASAEKLAIEMRLEEQSTANFIKLTRGINPDLLFESLEALIVVIQQDPSLADEMIDDLSLVYRFTLSKNEVEVIDINEEIDALVAFIGLINKLPYRQTKIINKIERRAMTVPGTLLFLIEKIIKSTIVTKHQTFIITLSHSEDHLTISYNPHDKLTQGFDADELEELNRSYSLYTDENIVINNTDQLRQICIPHLIIEN